VKWTKEHIKWLKNQWKQVIWSDESKISLFGSDDRKYVRRRVGDPDCIEETTTKQIEAKPNKCHDLAMCKSADGAG